MDASYCKGLYFLRGKLFTFICFQFGVFQAQLEDSGPYMCQLNTDPMKSKMGILNVIIRPDITNTISIFTHCMWHEA